jgi:hypothetical protein
MSVTLPQVAALSGVSTLSSRIATRSGVSALSSGVATRSGVTARATMSISAALATIPMATLVVCDGDTTELREY